MNKLKSLYYPALLLVLLGFLITIFALFTEAFNDGSYIIDATTAAQFGDYVGGFVGSLFSLAGVLLLFETLNRQKDAFQIQQFESAFFELLSIYRENVSEMVHSPNSSGSDPVRGRRVFIELRKQFGDIYNKIKTINKDNNDKLNEIDMVDISFNILLFGIGESTKTIIERILNKYRHKDTSEENVIDKIIYNFAFESAAKEDKHDGHQSRLGHYFRHLYQMVNFVHDKKYLTLDEKYKYMKILRAQMSTFELTIFFFNALSTFGEPWRKGTPNLIESYKLIKNIPSGITFDIEPKNYFKMTYEEDEVGLTIEAQPVIQPDR